MSSDVAIQIENLSKCYHIYDRPRDRLMQMIFRGRRTYFREFWAVRNVSFAVGKGSTVAIIGRNGAGKSTLLQMICGTLNPTDGRITVNGRVAALLELGAGFNPEFTGRENVYLSASLYGLTRAQIDERFETITSFANIGDYIEQPVKTYSSGMFVRLAFAVIAHVDADILIVDEALSVGDAFFQQKCMRFLQGFKENGGTLLFVSHDMGAVNALCETAVLLRREGADYLFDIGQPKDIAVVYLRDLYADRAAGRSGSHAPGRIAVTGNGGEASGTSTSAERATSSAKYCLDHVSPVHYHVSSFQSNADGFGLGDATITDVFFRDASGNAVTEFRSEDDVSLVVRASISREMAYPSVGFVLKDRTGQKLMCEGTDSYLRHHAIVAAAGAEVEAAFKMRFPALIRGEYALDVALAEGPGDEHVQQHLMHDVLVLTALGTNLVHGKFGAPGLSVSFELH